MREPTPTRNDFLERYPGVASEDLDRLLVKQRRWRTGALLLAAVLVLLTVSVVAAGLRAHSLATRDAPQIANAIATERYDGIQLRVDARTAEARQLVGDLFILLSDILENNPTLVRLEDEWRTATDNADLLLRDLAGLREAPLASSRNLWETGRDRIEAIVAAAARMIIAIQEFVPNAIAALDQADAELESETTFLQTLDLVEMLLVPLMESEQELVQRWAILRNRLHGWKILVESDVDAVRGSMRGEAMTQEFFDRLADAIW